MNTYIQNKLDEFDNNKFFKILNIPVDNVYAEKDGLRFDLQEINIKEIIEQSLTDYHNHIVEKWEHDIKLLKLIHKQELDSIALKSLEDFMEWSELRKLLQDTNTKE